MNNNFFSFVRHLRDRGHDARLLCIRRELQHFLPSADTLDDLFRVYTSELEWGNEGSFRKTSAARVLHDLGAFTHVVGCGMIPAFMAKSGRRLDIFSPYGADLYRLPHFSVKPYHKALREALSPTARWRMQRRGIRTSGGLHLSNVYVDAQGRDIAAATFGDGVFYAPKPLVYDYFSRIGADHPIWREPVLDRARQMRSQADFLVVNHNRQEWTSRTDWYTAKGNDVFLRGFAAFVRAPGAPERPALIAFEYGEDVAASKALAAELGIAEQVVWMPKSERREIYLMLTLADVGVGQFSPKGSYSSGVIQEVLACGRPLIHHTREENRQMMNLPAYPYVQSRTSEEVTSALMMLWKNAEKRQEIGECSRDWYRNFVVEPFIREFEKRLGLSP